MRGQVHAVFRIVGVFAHLLTQTEIGDFDFAAARSASQENVRRFQIEVYHGWFDAVVQVAKSTDGLHHHRARFFLRDQLVLFQEEVDVVAFDVFQHRAESTSEGTSGHVSGEVRATLRISVDLEDIEETNDPRVIQCFQNVTFAQGVSRTIDQRPIHHQGKLLDVIRFLLFFPFFVQLMNFHRHVPLFFQAEGLDGRERAERVRVRMAFTLCTSLKPPLPIRLSRR